MLVNTTIWHFARIDRFAPLPLGHGLARFALVILSIFLWTTIACGEERTDDRFDKSPVSKQSNLNSAKSGQSSPVNGDIASLLLQLDAQDFSKREYASEKLAAIGERAIGPLANHSFDCSPESCWRIKKTLEKICTSGSEPVFFKSIAVLKLRFNVGGHNNPALAQSLAKLETEWRQKRKRQAIAQLRESGATVLDPLENAGAEFQQFQAWRGQNLFIPDNGRFGPEPGSNLKTARKPATQTKLTEEELKLKIKLILESDVDENRELVFGRIVSQENPNSKDVGAARDIAIQLAMRNQIRANQIRVAGVQQKLNGSGVTITFDQKWKGESADLNLLNEIENVQQIVFSNRSITRDTIRSTSDIATVTKLVFDNCQFENRAFDDDGWQNVREIEWKNQEITSELIATCVSAPSIQSIMFDACQMDGSVLRGLAKSKSLRVLQFNEAEFDASVFKSLARIKGLSYINLTVCKFETDDYKMLRVARPTLQIRFTAQSFFGVRGPVNVGVERFQVDDNGKLIASNSNEQSTCEITDVIAGSGAHKAGMKIGDVVESVSGQKIGTFEDLRLHIAQHQAGDKLNVTVRRGNKPVKLEVELGSQKSAPRFEP